MVLLYPTAPPIEMVDYSIKLEQRSPFAPVPLRTFITTTGYSAAVPRIGTLTLSGASTLGFSLSIGTTASHVPHKKPHSGSCHFYAGRHPGSKQISPGFILVFSEPPVLTPHICVSTPQQWFVYTHLPERHLTRSYAMPFP